MTTENKVEVEDAARNLMDTCRGVAFMLRVMSVEKEGSSGDDGESDALHALSCSLYEAVETLERVIAQ